MQDEGAGTASVVVLGQGHPHNPQVVAPAATNQHGLWHASPLVEVEEKEECGEIVIWSHKSRYGFIKPNCGGDDVQLHVEDLDTCSDVPQFGWESKQGIVDATFYLIV